MSKSFSSDNFRKGKLEGKVITGVILLFFVLLFGVLNASAVECPPGFKWVRMSGVGCVQENCWDIEHAKLSYTSSCICIDGYKGCYESVDYTNFDKSKCFPNCPGARLVACVKPGEPCPGKEPEKKEERIEEEGIDEASIGLRVAVTTIKRMKEEGAGDWEIALKVNQIVNRRLDPINNFWMSPVSWLKDHTFFHYDNMDIGRASNFYDYHQLLHPFILLTKKISAF